MSAPKITGANVVAFLASAGEVSPVFEKKARETFKEYGITDPDESKWYDAGDYTDALFEFTERAGENTVQEAGREMVRINEPILEQDSIEDGLDVFTEQHKEVHKDFSEEDAGLVEYERIDDSTYRITGVGAYDHPEALLKGASMEVVIQTSDTTNVRVEDSEPQGDEVVAFKLNL